MGRLSFGSDFSQISHFSKMSCDAGKPEEKSSTRYNIKPYTHKECKYGLELRSNLTKRTSFSQVWMGLALQKPTVLSMSIVIIKLNCLGRRDPAKMEGRVAGLSLSQNNSRSLSVKYMKVLSFCLLFVFLF